MNTTSVSPASLLLALACLALFLPLTASAQGVPVITEDQFLGEDQTGETITVSITVENLDQAADINSYGITLDYGEPPVDFVKFETDSTLTSTAGFTTTQNDDEEAAQATIGGFGTTPLNTGGDSGTVVRAVFKITSGGSGLVTFPEVTLNGSSPPDADLTQADFSITIGGTTTINDAREQGPGTSATLSGTVTRAFGTYLRFQDESGPTGASGLAIRQVSGPLSEDFQQAIADGTIRQGTRLTVQGTLSERDNLLLISDEDLDSYSVAGQGPLPFSQSVLLFELEAPDGVDYESELLRIEGLAFDDPNATGGTLDANTTYTIVSEGGTAFDYRVGSAAETDLIGAPIPEGTFTYEGVLGRSTGGFALVPIRRSTGLPVEMAGFTAVETESGALLKWRTVSETNNAGFEVQHQGPDATGFTDVGFVEGAGTTTSSQRYEYRLSDLQPGTHRFRLQQRDTDGTTTLTDPVVLSAMAERALSLGVTGPNPVRQETWLTFTVGRSGPVKVSLYDMLGQKTRTLFNQTATAGKRYTVELDAGDLPSGQYLAQLFGPSGTRTQQILVVR